MLIDLPAYSSTYKSSSRLLGDKYDTRILVIEHHSIYIYHFRLKFKSEKEQDLKSLV